MTAAEIDNWIAVYAATGLCCACALVLSVATIVVEVFRERIWQDVNNWPSAVLFAPKLWWRWQKRYMLSTPVTLTIVGWFATTLNWAH